MDPGDELEGSAQVMRVCVLRPAFFPDRTRTDHFIAIPDIFELSTADKADAQKRSTEPMLSVFDRERTSLLQAKSLRRLDVPDDDVAGFSVKVAAIKEAASKFLPHRNVRVFRDPYTDERADEPGCDGHSVVVGTDRREGESRNQYKAFRVELARQCEILRCE